MWDGSNMISDMGWVVPKVKYQDFTPFTSYEIGAYIDIFFFKWNFP